MRVDMKKLQSLINKSVRAHNDASMAGSALNDYCEKTYGVSPSDVDADAIIDSCFGGCGQSSGMSAEEFHQIMKDFAVE